MHERTFHFMDAIYKKCVSTNQSFMKSSAHCFRLISEGKFCFLISCYLIVNLEITAQLNKKYVPRGKNYPNHTVNVSMFRCCVNLIIFYLEKFSREKICAKVI